MYPHFLDNLEEKLKSILSVLYKKYEEHSYVDYFGYEKKLVILFKEMLEEHKFEINNMFRFEMRDIVNNEMIIDWANEDECDDSVIKQILYKFYINYRYITYGDKLYKNFKNKYLQKHIVKMNNHVSNNIVNHSDLEAIIKPLECAYLEANDANAKKSIFNKCDSKFQDSLTEVFYESIVFIDKEGTVETMSQNCIGEYMRGVSCFKKECLENFSLFEFEEFVHELCKKEYIIDKVMIDMNNKNWLFECIMTDIYAFYARFISKNFNMFREVKSVYEQLKGISINGNMTEMFLNLIKDKNDVIFDNIETFISEKLNDNFLKTVTHSREFLLSLANKDSNSILEIDDSYEKLVVYYKSLCTLLRGSNKDTFDDKLYKDQLNDILLFIDKDIQLLMRKTEDLHKKALRRVSALYNMSITDEVKTVLINSWKSPIGFNNRYYSNIEDREDKIHDIDRSNTN